ncbi:hypothetical protein F3G48_31940 [Pseudomonas aeruginosa]|nr:hypothetical protein F3G48_31940 [Pseudomonas aeruginosa]
MEHLVMKNKYEKRNSSYNLDNKGKKIDEKKPCPICLNEKKGKRFHQEDSCWFKEKNKKAMVKTVNNSELEIELNEKNPKN